MSNSSLVNYTRLSPNNSGKRKHSIDRITPHCVVGQCSVETLGNIFAPSSRQASCNYAIGSDGRVALIVDEGNCSWCSSSNSNDQRAVTIECASDTYDPYAFNDVVYNKLIDLCVDICRRNGKNKLLWIGEKNAALAYNPAPNEMVITLHRWFKQKSCPGDWLVGKMSEMVDSVNNKLTPPPKPFVPPKDVKNGVYRLYNSNSGEHFFTVNTNERNNLMQAGWNYEGVGWKAPNKSKTPVYRLYNPNAGDHHYTTSVSEKNSIVSKGWKYEGIAFYSDDKKKTKIYRVYNPNSGRHMYTASSTEKNNLIKAGWKDEGVAFYGM